MLFGQENLILNGDFEEYWECPDDATQIERCKYVYNPLPYGNLTGFNSTSDYMNSCSIAANVPNTFNGYQNAFSGNAFVGFYAADNPNFRYREYVQLSLGSNLQCGSIYTFRGYFNVSNLYKYTIKNIGFFFSLSELEEQDYLYNMYTPQYVDRITEINDTMNWTLITFDFVAHENYRYLTIGHFEKDSLESYVEINPSAVSQLLDCYLNMDSVSIVEKGVSELLLPNVFTPNGDEINDIFYLPNNSTMFASMLVFNRWGNQVAELAAPFEWDGTANNEKMSDGVYYYVLIPNEGCESKKSTKHQGMIHLIR